MNWNQQPKYVYTVKQESRGAAPVADDKKRLTTMVAATAAGSMLPSFNIMKASTKSKEDMQGSTVLNKFLADIVFNPQTALPDGALFRPWEKKMWSKTLTLKEGTAPKLYTRPYLLHRVYGDVITVQGKAWNDSIGMIMWVELVMSPIAAKSPRGLYMIMDNCGSHQVLAVQAAFAAANIKIGKLPPRMTSELQAMDIMVNGPLKAAIRRERSMQLYDHFQVWVANRRANILSGVPSPNFTPPAMSIQQGLLLVIETLRKMGSDQEFRRNLHRVFITIGQISDENGCFRRYPEQHGMLHDRTERIMNAAVGTLADVFAAFTVDVRRDWETVCECSSPSDEE